MSLRSDLQKKRVREIALVDRENLVLTSSFQFGSPDFCFFFSSASDPALSTHYKSPFLIKVEVKFSLNFTSIK